MSPVVAGIGGRKMVLGMIYLLGGIGCIVLSLLRDADAGVIAAVAGAFVSFATGLGVVVWGNVQEHRAKNGDA